jgi:peptidoglycan hydrolase FlgJ
MSKISMPGLPTAPPAPIRPANPLTAALNKPDADPATLAKAAQDFEAMALGELLQPMFQTVDAAHGMFGGGDAEATWRPMLVQEMAKQIAAHGGLGLAQPIYQELLRMQAAKSK